MWFADAELVHFFYTYKGISIIGCCRLYYYYFSLCLEGFSSRNIRSILDLTYKWFSQPRPQGGLIVSPYTSHRLEKRVPITHPLSSPLHQWSQRSFTLPYRSVPRLGSSLLCCPLYSPPVPRTHCCWWNGPQSNGVIFLTDVFCIIGHLSCHDAFFPYLGLVITFCAGVRQHSHVIEEYNLSEVGKTWTDFYIHNGIITAISGPRFILRRLR